MSGGQPLALLIGQWQEPLKPLFSVWLQINTEIRCYPLRLIFPCIIWIEHVFHRGGSSVQTMTKPRIGLDAGEAFIAAHHGRDPPQKKTICSWSPESSGSILTDVHFTLPPPPPPQNQQFMQFIKGHARGFQKFRMPDVMIIEHSLVDLRTQRTIIQTHDGHYL
jgi:hypothetical protein